MTQIKHPNLERIAQEHYLGIKAKLGEFPTGTPYTLEEVVKAKPYKLDEIATWAMGRSDFDFMVKKYKNFTTKKTREYDAYDLAEKLNINVCPYCNINPTYTVITKNRVKIIRPEFDHFYDKATHPILALSFYNLVPSCHVCNSSLKGIDRFTVNTHINPYSESFDSVAKFRVRFEDSTFYHSVDGLGIEIETDDERAKKCIETFKLKERYNHHKDTILELIQKAEVYNDSYLDELMQHYEGTLFKNREDLLRLVTCGYITDEEIGKRPLSKLIKDISQELDLI